jgi:hypothetical protein
VREVGEHINAEHDCPHDVARDEKKQAELDHEIHLRGLVKRHYLIVGLVELDENNDGKLSDCAPETNGEANPPRFENG